MEKWFQNGLRFKCTECGKCCTGSPGYVWVTEEDILNMADALKISTDLFKRKYIRFKDNRLALIEQKNPPYDCVFLKNNQCSIYQARPKQCRTFPWWQQNLKSEAAWKEAAKECEGIRDDAPLHTYDEICRQLDS